MLTTSLKTIWKFLAIFKVLLRGQMRREIMFGGKKAPKPHHDCEASWRVEPPWGPGHLYTQWEINDYKTLQRHFQVNIKAGVHEQKLLRGGVMQPSNNSKTPLNKVQGCCGRTWKGLFGRRNYSEILFIIVQVSYEVTGNAKVLIEAILTPQQLPRNTFEHLLVQKLK